MKGSTTCSHDNLWGANGILRIECMVFGALVRNKMMGDFFVLFMFDFVWSFEKESSCVFQDILQLPITQASLTFSAILFLQ